MNRDDLAALPRVDLFGLPVTAARPQQIVQLLAQRAATRVATPFVVVTPNVDHVVRFEKNPALRQQYLQADMLLVDGAPLILAARLLRRPLPGRVTGADLMPALLSAAAGAGLSVHVVGGVPGSEEADLAILRARYPGLRVTMRAPGMGFDPQGAEAADIAADIAQQSPQMVFVCLGFPRQEQWALLHRQQLGGAVVLCCGAALDFVVGRVRRAPSLLRRTGLEWLWRLLSEPRRLWRRYLVDDVAFFRILISEMRKS